MAKRDALKDYHAKRDFDETPEPRGEVLPGAGNRYLIQKHAARRLHYDFRLELDGVLKSWAVTKGPSLDPADKRLAVRTEDHPVDYGDFEGVIPSGYGAGTVMLWDTGTWEPQDDPHEGLKKGRLKIRLHGDRLRGGFALIRMKPRPGEKRENWLLIKERDDEARDDVDVIERFNTSVTTDRSMGEIERGRKRRPRKAGKKPRAAKGGRGLRFVPPQLATLRDSPPSGEEWLHEVKYDGYRVQALITGGTVRLMTRNGKDWTHRYGPVADALAELDVDDAIIDGELVAVDADGLSDFGALQNADDGTARLVYYAFDLLRLDGTALVSQPLEKRKEKLRDVLGEDRQRLRFSDHIEGEGARVIEQACTLKLEGIISKKRSAGYRSGRSRTWIKSKCIGNDEFVIGGYRESDKAGRAFSSLLLGEYVDGRLEYRGRVGTGFSDAVMTDLAREMMPLIRESSPFRKLPAAAKNRAVWLEPRLVAQINYTERTSDGVLRHPSFLGLREDKEAVQVTAQAQTTDGATRVDGVRLTSPDRVMYPQQGATKRAIAEYYARHAARILPLVQDRPLSLVRCPSGRDGECFFQRHPTGSLPEDIDQLVIEESSGKKAPYLYVHTKKGLIATAQIGALELHLWGVRTDRLEHPERVVFDLDPDERLSFADVRDAALEMREVLASLGLKSFPLLTGGKGIHVIAPVVRRRTWDEVKPFARGLASQLAEAAPNKYVATASKSKRKGRIFIDWLRNERGGTAIAPYSLRARAGAPIAIPLSWAELPRAESAAAYTLGNINRRLSRLKSDPWEGYHDTRQSITRAQLDAVT